MTASAIARLVMTPTTSAARGRRAPWKTIAAPGAVAPETRQHEAQQVDVAADDGAPLDEVVDQPVGVVHALAPEAGTRRDQADDPALVLDDHRAQIVDVFPADALAVASSPRAARMNRRSMMSCACWTR